MSLNCWALLILAKLTWMKQNSVFVGDYFQLWMNTDWYSRVFTAAGCVCDQIKINYRVHVNRKVRTCLPETWRFIFEGLVDDKRNISDVTRGAAGSAGARFESIVHIDLVGWTVNTLLVFLAPPLPPTDSRTWGSTQCMLGLRACWETVNLNNAFPPEREGKALRGFERDLLTLGAG